MPTEMPYLAKQDANIFMRAAYFMIYLHCSKPQTKI